MTMIITEAEAMTGKKLFSGLVHQHQFFILFLMSSIDLM